MYCLKLCSDQAIMPKNVEVKAKIKDFNKIIDIARNLCEGEAKILIQEDWFFNTPTGRLKLRNFQDGSDSQLIYYNRPDTENPKTSDYSICYIKNPVELLNTLSPALGLKGSVKKTRHLFLYGQTRIHVDQVEGLGDFLELEVVLGSNDTVKKGEEIAYCLIKKLEISEEDFIRGAYIDLILNK